MRDSQPRVLHLCDNREGVAESLAALAPALTALGWNATIGVLGRSAISDELRAARVDVVELGGRGHADPLMWGRLARRMRKDRPALIHAWGVPATIAALLTRPRRPRVPVAATLDLRDAAVTWTPRVLRSLAPQLAAVIAADESTLRSLASMLGDVARRSPAAVIPPPFAPLPPPAASRAEAFARWNFPAEARLILTAGRLQRIAYVDEAIWAYELVRVLHPKTRLAIAGAGPDRERLERFARQVSDPGCIVFLGDQRDELSAAMAAAEIYWQLGPSVGTPPGLAQAMLAGKPIVASDAAVHGTLAAGDALAIVPQGGRAEATRATDDFLQDAELAAKYAAAARQRATERFAVEKAADAYAALYAAAAS